MGNKIKPIVVPVVQVKKETLPRKTVMPLPSKMYMGKAKNSFIFQKRAQA